MKAQIVSCTHRGNTGRVAARIGETLRAHGAEVEVIDVARAPVPPPKDLDRALQPGELERAERWAEHLAEVVVPAGA